ncbi:MAG: mechanosensitive ion channel family protein [Bdellovibrionota bacterium]
MKFLSILFLSLLGSLAWSQEPAKLSADTVESCIPAVYARITIICLRSKVGAFSPEERVHAIEQKVEKLSLDASFDLNDIVAVTDKTSTDIDARDIILLSVHDADAADMGMTRDLLAGITVGKIKSALKQSRDDRRPRTLLLATVYTLLSVIVFALLLFFISKIYSRAYRTIATYKDTKIRPISVRNYELLTSDRIVALITWIAQVSRFLLTVLLIYLFLPIVFSFFPATENLSGQLIGYVVEPLKQIAHHAVAFIPNLFFIAIIGVVTKYVLGFVRFIFNEIERGSLQIPGFYRDWAEPTYKLVRVSIWAFALVMAFPYIPGSSSPAFQGISVFAGLLLSIGSSSAISNMVAGIVITYMRPFRLGDRVRISDTVGDVIEKNLLITRVKTIKEVEITIPNSMVLSSHIINYSATSNTTGMILNTSVTIGYDVPWKNVHAALLEAARRTELIEKTPIPFVLQTALSDFFVAYEINASTRSPNKMATIYSVLHQNIQDSFNEAGIEIMSPHYTSLRDGNGSTIPAGYRTQKSDQAHSDS